MVATFHLFKPHFCLKVQILSKMSTTDSRKTVPTILDGTFFKIIEEHEEGKVLAKCLHCPDSESNISGSFHPTSNFTTHLKVRIYYYEGLFSYIYFFCFPSMLTAITFRSPFELLGLCSAAKTEKNIKTGVFEFPDYWRIQRKTSNYEINHGIHCTINEPPPNN